MSLKGRKTVACIFRKSKGPRTEIRLIRSENFLKLNFELKNPNRSQFAFKMGIKQSGNKRDTSHSSFCLNILAWCMPLFFREQHAAL